MGDNINVDNKVYIYSSEIEVISRYIMDYPNIETGGQLFGYVTDSGIAVVTFAIGPGPKAVHNIDFFGQDIDYLDKIGSELNAYLGLQHVGEWHSHHQLKLRTPSCHDANNISKNIKKTGLDQFVLCIGNCDDSVATINPFVFKSENREVYDDATWVVIKGFNPYREKIDSWKHVLEPAIKTQVFNYNGIVCIGDFLIPEKYSNALEYWFSDFGNHKALKYIVEDLKNKGVDHCRVFIDDNHLVNLLISINTKTITISFPKLFPNEPPIMWNNNKFYKGGGWYFDGDIANSLSQYINNVIKDIKYE